MRRETHKMLVISLTLVFFSQVGCEWVQISQQHYKKPLRPAHEHPLLATVMKTSEPTQPTHSNPVKTTVDTTSYPSRPTEEHAVSPIVKSIDSERTTKRNRIYINHTLQDNRWDKDVHVMDFNQKHEFVTRKPPLSEEIVVDKPKSKGDVLIIRRPKPDKIENSAKTDKPSGHGSVIPGSVQRVNPQNNKESHKTPKPLEEYKGPIEVLNMADLEYTTAEDTFEIKVDKDVMKSNDKRKQVTESSVSFKGSDKRKKEPPEITDQRNHGKLHHETNIKPPTVLKGISNLRRVEILRSTKPTLIEEYENNEQENISMSTKPGIISQKNTKNREGGTDVTPYKFPNIGHVNRVRKANTTRSTRKPKPHTKYTPPEYVDEEDNSTEQSEEIVNIIRRADKPTRRSTTEKTFPVRPKPMLKKGDQSTKIPDPENVMLEELTTENEKQFDIKVHKVASTGTVKKVPNPTKTPEISKGKLDRHNVIKEFATPTPKENFDEDVTVEDEYSDHGFNDQYKNDDYATSTEEIPIHTTAKPKPIKTTATRRPEIVPQIERYGPNPNKPVRPSKRPGYIKKENNFEYDADLVKTTESNRKSNRNNIQIESINQENTKRNDNFKNNNANDSKTKKEADESVEDKEPLSNDKKNNAMENLIKFLKTVTEIIARNTRRGVHGKLRYLEDLRDTLMANIEERIEAAFPDDPPGPTSGPGSRRERSAEPRGHVEFPSSEGALMTISFLTFAVFLIKLVLQVIQAYKNKTMMMMPTVVAAVGRAYTERRRTNN